MEKRYEIRLTAHGLSLEKLVLLAGEKGIPLKNVKRSGMKALTAVAQRRDFPRLLVLAQERGWELEENGAVGLLKMRNRAERHIGVLIGALLAAMLMAAAFQFVWHIEIVDAGAYLGDIRTVLGDMGIRSGILKSQVDVEKLNDMLTYRYKKTAWVQTTFRGAFLVIRVIEGVPTPEIETEGKPKDVIAKEAGIIVSVEPYAGTPTVKIGDFVKKGQVLIRGEEREGGGEMTQVKARGRVLARTWESAKVLFPAFEVVSKPTGRSDVRREIETPFGTLFSEADVPFEKYDTRVDMWRAAFFPITFLRVTHYEIETEKAPRDVATLKKEAAEAALLKLSEKLAMDDEVIDKWVDYCMIEGTEMEAAAAAQILRDIAE